MPNQIATHGFPKFKQYNVWADDKVKYTPQNVQGSTALFQRKEQILVLKKNVF